MEGIRVLLIRDEQTFMVNALISNLESEEYTVVESGFPVKDVIARQADADIMILYADEKLNEHVDTLVYLKDLCLEKGRLLIIIGSREELDMVENYIPAHLAAEVFERPLDMNRFIEKLNNQLSDDTIESRKKSILLVDDDPSYLQLLREWLKEDYRIGMARSGMQAITWLARNNVDLILLDYEMPVTDGLQVYEMLKSEQFSKDIPIMFLTGKSDKETIMRVMALKPAGYLLKNISQEQLLSSIDKYFVKEQYNKL